MTTLKLFDIQFSKYLKKVLLGIGLLIVVLFFSGWIGFEVWLDFQTRDMRKNVRAPGKAVLRVVKWQQSFWGGYYDEELNKQYQIIQSFSVEDRIDFYKFFILKCLDYNYMMYISDYFYDELLRKDMDAVKPLMDSLATLRDNDKFMILTSSQQGKVNDAIQTCNWLLQVD